MAGDLSVKTVTIEEVFDAEGKRQLEISTEGDASVWDVIGFCEYAIEVGREQIRADIRGA